MFESEVNIDQLLVFLVACFAISMIIYYDLVECNEGTQGYLVRCVFGTIKRLNVIGDKSGLEKVQQR
jgi:hypothetical protein